MATEIAPKTPKPKSSTLLNGTPLVINSCHIPHSGRTSQSELKSSMKIELGSQVFQSHDVLQKVFGRLPENIDQVIDDCLTKFKPLPTTGSEEEHYQSLVGRLNEVKKSLGNHGLMTESIYQNAEFKVYQRKMEKGTGRAAPLQPDIIAQVPPHDENKPVSWSDVELCVEVKGKYADMIAQGATYARSILEAQNGRSFVLILFYEHTEKNFSFGLFTTAWLCLSYKINLSTVVGQREFVREMAKIWTCKQRWRAGFDMTRNNNSCYLKGFGTFYTRRIFHRVSVRGRRTRVDLLSRDDSQNVNASQNDDDSSKIYGIDQYFAPRGNELQVSSTTSEQQLQTSQGSERLECLAADQVASTTQKHELSKPPVRRSPRFTNQTARDKNFSQNFKDLIPKDASIPSPKGSLSPPPPVLPCNLPVFREEPQLSRVVLKDSWVTLTRENQEEAVFNSVRRKFGVPEVLTSLVVTFTNELGEEVKSDTAFIFPDDAKRCKLWKITKSPTTADASQASSQDDSRPEHRIHVRLLTLTEGDMLYRAESPKKLLQAILHSMLGYRALFQNGWLHRDVSIGNVLLMKTPEPRDEIDGFEKVLTEDIRRKYFAKCTGFITDGDLAVRWDTTDRDVGKQRSGTPPFMSIRLIDAVIVKTDTAHSPFDDLESFVWVLFWAIPIILNNNCKASMTGREKDYLSTLQSRDWKTLRGKSYFVQTLRKQKKKLELQEQQVGETPVVGNDNTFSPGFRPFVELLREWLTLAEALHIADPFDDSSQTSKSHFKSHFEEYLKIGIENLERLPDSWSYIEASHGGYEEPPRKKLKVKGDV